VFSIGGSGDSVEQAANKAASRAADKTAGIAAGRIGGSTAVAATIAAARAPRMATGPALRGRRRRTFNNMWLLFLEAFVAMMALILIIWWTMFHGRKKGERIER
jgi:hypothetical protein